MKKIEYLEANWLLILVAIFSGIAMLNSIEANTAANAAKRNASNAADYALNAATESRGNGDRDNILGKSVL